MRLILLALAVATAAAVGARASQQQHEHGAQHPATGAHHHPEAAKLTWERTLEFLNKKLR